MLSTTWRITVAVWLLVATTTSVHSFTTISPPRGMATSSPITAATAKTTARRQPSSYSSRKQQWRQTSRLSVVSNSKNQELATTDNPSTTTTNPLFDPQQQQQQQLSIGDSSKGNDHVYEQAIRRTLVWVAAAFAFGTGLGIVVGPETSEEFFAGYLLEQSLSVDNLLVFLLLFEYFQIPTQYQNRVLNWGILGAIPMRAIMIRAGAVAIQQFHVVLLGFAAILIYSSANVLLLGGDDDEEDDFSQNQIVRFSNNLIQSTTQFDGDRFFTEIDGKRLATPMFLCMVAVEFSDVVFAVDSIPAVFGVTENPLVVFTSNMFAIMGLRSLYIILSKAASELKYLEPAVAVVLGFIGCKMVAEYFGVGLPTELSLVVVGSLLSGGVGLSLLEQQQNQNQDEEPQAEPQPKEPL